MCTDNIHGYTPQVHYGRTVYRNILYKINNTKLIKIQTEFLVIPNLKLSHNMSHK